MLIPQGLAYGLLAGLPPQLGLYASVLPLVAYGLLGASAPLSVGPFAIASIMTASTLALLFPDPATPISHHILAASIMACLSGAFLIALGALRLGFLTTLISFPVVTGFICACTLIIILNQCQHILGISFSGADSLNQLTSLADQWDSIHTITAILAVCSLSLFIALPRLLERLFIRLGAPPPSAATYSKTAPLIVITAAIIASKLLNLSDHGVVMIGTIPAGLPTLSLPEISALNGTDSFWKEVITASFFIGMISYITSLSTAQTFAVKAKQRICPNQESIALGAANMASGLSGAFPVAASLSRSAVSQSAGAKTPATSLFAAAGIAISCVTLPGLLSDLPLAILSALIIVAIAPLINPKNARRLYDYNRPDFFIWLITLMSTLIGGLAEGLALGILLSLAHYIYRSSKPHVAICGLIEGTEHFRNVLRHEVITVPEVVSIRIDANLYFANARFLEDTINHLIVSYPDAKHVILQCNPINSIDASALNSLFVCNNALKDAGITFHLSEVKGPVMDRLERSDFLSTLTGCVYLSHYQAWSECQSTN